MNCWLLSGWAVDPTLHITSDSRRRSRLQGFDTDSRRTSTSMISSCTDDWATTTDLLRYWSFDEKEADDDNERCSAPWLSHEQKEQSVVDWCERERSTSTSSSSPTFSAADETLSHCVWRTLSPSSLLDYDDDGDHNIKTTLDERPAWESYATSTCVDEGCSTIKRCTSRGATSFGACSATIYYSTSSNYDDVELAGSVGLPSSHSDDIVNDDWKRRRRRRRHSKRWSRRHQSATITRQHSVDDHRPPHILRSLLVHGCRSTHRAPSYRSSSSTESVVSSPGSVSVSAGHAIMGRDEAAVAQRQSVWMSLMDRSLTAATDKDDDAETVLQRCLEDHCYFSRKQEATANYYSISRCETRTSTVLELILRHTGPLQPNKGSIANVTATRTAAATAQRSDIIAGSHSVASLPSACYSNSNSTSECHRHRGKPRRLLRQLLTGNEQKFWGDESKHFDNDENAVAVINTRDLKIAVKDVRERLASNSCEYDVGDKNTAKGEVKESNAHHNELHSSTNSQPDENENFEDYKPSHSLHSAVVDVPE